jgi:LPS sulfotransferase NodH
MIGRAKLLAGRKYLELCVYKSGYFNAQIRAKKFVIFGPGRSGSTLLVKLLNTNEDIYCDMEELRFKRWFPEKYIESRSRSNVSSKPIYGFKVQHNHLALNELRNEKNFIDHLYNSEWKFIFLWRKNFFRQAISLALARQREVWFVTEEEHRKKNVDIDIDPFILLLDQIANSHQVYRTLLKNVDFLELTYEDDLLNTNLQTKALAKIANFINAKEGFSVETDMKKTIGNNISEGVSNWSELLNSVRETRHAEMIQEFYE